MIHIVEPITKKSYDLIQMENTAPVIEGVNTEEGLLTCCGSVDAYREVLGSFLEDSTAKICDFEVFEKKTIQNLDDSELHKFNRAAHAIKGISAIIGAQDLSKKAAGLEIASEAADRKIMQDDFLGFFEDLKIITERVQSFLHIISMSEG